QIPRNPLAQNRESRRDGFGSRFWIRVDADGSQIGGERRVHGPAQKHSVESGYPSTRHSCGWIGPANRRHGFPEEGGGPMRIRRRHPELTCIRFVPNFIPNIAALEM